MVSSGLIQPHSILVSIFFFIPAFSYPPSEPWTYRGEFRLKREPPVPQSNQGGYSTINNYNQNKNNNVPQFSSTNTPVSGGYTRNPQNTVTTLTSMTSNNGFSFSTTPFSMMTTTNNGGYSTINSGYVNSNNGMTQGMNRPTSTSAIPAVPAVPAAAAIYKFTLTPTDSNFQTMSIVNMGYVNNANNNDQGRNQISNQMGYVMGNNNNNQQQQPQELQQGAGCQDGGEEADPEGMPEESGKGGGFGQIFSLLKSTLNFSGVKNMLKETMQLYVKSFTELRDGVKDEVKNIKNGLPDKQMLKKLIPNVSNKIPGLSGLKGAFSSLTSGFSGSNDDSDKGKEKDKETQQPSGGYN